MKQETIQPRSEKQDRLRPAFTLIELLVVIAIIALLVSLLMPSLKQAKELAKQSMCLSNMRMAATAMPQYADEHEGWMPPNAVHGFGFRLP